MTSWNGLQSPAPLPPGTINYKYRFHAASTVLYLQIPSPSLVSTFLNPSTRNSHCRSLYSGPSNALQPFFTPVSTYYALIKVLRVNKVLLKKALIKAEFSECGYIEASHSPDGSNVYPLVVREIVAISFRTSICWWHQFSHRQTNWLSSRAASEWP